MIAYMFNKLGQPVSLTELQIKHLKAKPKPYRIGDSGGLCIEVSPSGSKLWRWRYYFNGKPQVLALGKYPLLSLSEARKKRDEARKLLDSGKHPTREKKAQKLRNAHEGENTFEIISRKWLAQGQRALNEKYRKQCLRCMEQYIFPLIGDLPITEISIPDVVGVIEKISNRGTIETAKRMKQLMGQIFRYAAQRGMCEHNPAADLRGLLSTPERKHHACIPINELPEFLQKLDARKNDMSKYAMQLLALTFVRTGELIGARWEEIHWERAEWHIPKERMKMKRPHVVPLSKQALDIFKELHVQTGQRPFIFHSFASKAKHISNGTVLMALRRMGYQNRMTGHGFRSLASTILNEKGYNADWIERQLAHEDNDKIRSAYNRAEYLPERKNMMQKYADILDQLKKEKVVTVEFSKKTA